jgi:competence protein ComEC
LATALDLLSIDMLVLSKYTGSPKDTTPAALQALTPSGRSKLVRVHAGDSLTLAGMPVEVLWPPADADAAAWTANDLSLVLRVHAGPRTVLFTGDIEGRALRELLAADAAGTIHLASDVLIAPHHGSLVPESAAFYAAVNPQVVVASSAEERPKLAALVDSALGAEAQLLSTARSGAVTVSVQPDGELRLETAW